MSSIKTRSLRVRCLTSAAFTVLFLVQPAQGQTAPERQSAGQPEAEPAVPADILVTGIRRSNNVAIQSKRAAVNIVDVVSANDVQALPDTTIVEALRRIPGLSVLPIGDNEHARDEAATPVIRGLGPVYNNVTIDGMQIASPGTPQGTEGSTSRGVRLDILPSSMISELQVTKTFTPDLDANAIGGAINLKTRSAFDAGSERFLTLEVGAGHASDTDRPRNQPDIGPRIIGTASGTFADGMLGVVLSGNYQRLDNYTDAHMTTDTAFYNFYNAAGQIVNNGASTANAGFGNGIPVPQQDKYWYVQNRRDRYGLTGKLEARPTDTLYVFGQGGFYYYGDREVRNEAIINPNVTTQVFDQTPTSGRFPVASVELGYADLDITSRTRLGLGGLDWKPGGRSSLSGRISYSRATYDEELNYFKYNSTIRRATPGRSNVTTVPIAANGFTYETGSFNQSFNISPTAYNDLSTYSLSYWRPNGSRNIEDKILQGRLDYGFNQGPDDLGFGFAAGGSYTDDDFSFAVNRTQYVPNNTAPALGLADAAGPLNAPLRYNQNDLQLITIDPARALAAVQALPTSALNQTDTTAFNAQDNFTHGEKTGAIHGSFSYRGERVDARAGVRYDHTEQRTVSTVLQQGSYRPLPTRSTYHFLLPSALVTYHVTPRIDLRGVFSQTIGRPGYDAYAARSSISFQQESDVGNPDAQNVSVSIGNPDIRPRRSTNYDLAADWQFAERYGGIVSLALFDKEIRDEIFAEQSIGYQAPSGIFYTNAAVTRPANAGKSRIRGVEFNVIVNSLEGITPYLRGVGVAGNVAYLDGRLNVTMADGTPRRTSGLVGQSKYTLNGQAFYSAHGLELRVAYNRQARSIRAINTTASWQDLYWAPRQQVDFSARYDLTSAISLSAQASNITHERVTSLVGPERNLLKDTYSVPTTYWLSLRFTPARRSGAR
ncbi:TonB-dependent receptor [Sphingomonas sp. DT-51]